MPLPPVLRGFFGAGPAMELPEELLELDAPREYYIDTANQLVYFYPPATPTADGPAVTLMYQPGGVLNVTSAATDVRISNMSVVNGRHAGILA